MAVAGKVAITPKGAWDSTALYDKLSLVTHENAIYIAKNQSQGVVPVDGEYWMFCMQNAGAEDIQNIVNGTTIVGKATNDSDGNKISETYMKKILELSETDVSDETELVSYEEETPKKRTSVKMWEYIKGKIDSVLGIKGISNNVVTTESGYAADATQLNATVEGSYAKGVAENITKINADLVNLILNGNTLSIPNIAIPVCITGGGKDFIFSIPIGKYAPYTKASIHGSVAVRQNGNYLIGSSAQNAEMTFTGNVYNGNLIHVHHTFSTSFDSVINNAVAIMVITGLDITFS